MNTDSQLAVSSAVLLRTAGLSFLVTISLRSLKFKAQSRTKLISKTGPWLVSGFVLARAVRTQEKQEVHTQLQHSQLRLIF